MTASLPPKPSAHPDELSMTGHLVREDVGGVPFTRLLVAFDVTLPTERNKLVRLNDDVFKDHPCRSRLLRMVFESFKPLIEAMGKHVLIVHECNEGLIILTGEYEDGGSTGVHAAPPLRGMS